MYLRYEKDSMSSFGKDRKMQGILPYVLYYMSNYKYKKKILGTYHHMICMEYKKNIWLKWHMICWECFLVRAWLLEMIGKRMSAIVITTLFFLHYRLSNSLLYCLMTSSLNYLRIVTVTKCLTSPIPCYDWYHHLCTPLLQKEAKSQRSKQMALKLESFKIVKYSNLYLASFFRQLESILVISVCKLIVNN